ncbi:hypothetical protein GCM10009753_41270 [Streptantibioticus ferralitis]
MGGSRRSGVSTPTRDGACEVRRITGEQSFQKHHRGYAPPSAVAVSVAGRSIPRAIQPVAGVPGSAVNTERSQMDYCSSCRRVLNGALVCPGCGAYAPDIAPPAHRPHSTAPTAMTWDEFPAPASHPGTHRPDPAPFGTGVSEAAVADEPVAASSSGFEGTATGQGRAARRRQMARWKKSRRRAAVASAVALVGGGLTIAALPSGPSTGHAQAATMPKPATPESVRPDTTVSSTARPDTQVPQHRGTDTSSPVTTSPPQLTTVQATPAPTMSPQPDTTVTTHPPTATSPLPRTTPAPTNATPVYHTAAPAPQTNAPTSTDGSGAGAPSASPAPPTASSPTPVCLLVVCLY